MSNEVLDTNKPHPHRLHFYDTGNILLEVENVLFRIHQEVLCRHSEVFKDMFSLDLAGDMDGLGDQCNDRKVTLHENPEDFATFLDIIYEVPGIDLTYVRQCVRLSLLAHKYEVPHILERCRSNLIASLPIGATERDFWIAEEAYEDASIIPSLLRAARLIDMPNVIPWAVYELSVQFESKPRWVTKNKAILEPLSEHVRATHTLKRHIISRWGKFVTRFMKEDCDAEWWVEEDDCWRRTTLEDLENSGFMVEKDTLDPLRDMHAAMEFCCEGLCSICSDTWVKCATAFMEYFLEGVGSVVWD